MEQLSDVGLIGLGVMGENLALNMERNGRRVSVWNRTVPGGLFGLVRVCGIFEPTENYYDDGAGWQCSG